MPPFLFDYFTINQFWLRKIAKLIDRKNQSNNMTNLLVFCSLDAVFYFFYFYPMKHDNLEYFILNKPYGYLSQFTDKLNRKTLANLKNIPKNVYPVGRLDMDSEGLLLLSNDKLLVDYLLNPQ